MTRSLNWEFEKTVEFIHENKVSKVGLQFPDNLLKYSDIIASSIKEKFVKKYNLFIDVYVLIYYRVNIQVVM